MGRQWTRVHLLTCCNLPHGPSLDPTLVRARRDNKGTFVPNRSSFPAPWDERPTGPGSAADTASRPTSAQLPAAQAAAGTSRRG